MIKNICFIIAEIYVYIYFCNDKARALSRCVSHLQAFFPFSEWQGFCHSQSLYCFRGSNEESARWAHSLHHHHWLDQLVCLFLFFPHPPFVCVCVRVCISSLGLGHFLGCCVYIHLVACLELLAGFPWSYWSVHATIVSLWEKLLPGGRIVSALLSLFLRLVFCFSHNA